MIMKTRLLLLSVLISPIMFLGFAESAAESPLSEGLGLKIGVLSVQKIFQDCKKNAEYRKEIIAERQRLLSELDALQKEIEAAKAGLKTLKIGSDDYVARTKQILEKQANFQANQEFYKMQLELKDQKWTEQLYLDILRATEEIAKEKQLDLVLEKSEVEFPAAGANDLMLTIRTNKLLYSAGCLDISEEVMNKLDLGSDNQSDNSLSG